MTRITLTDPLSSFRILQLTDLHFMGEGQEPPHSPLDRETLRLIDDLITTSEPDLIVMTGDQVYGPQNLASQKQLLDALDTYAKPYTLCFGNHDSEASPHDRRALVDEAMMHTHCLLTEAHTMDGRPLPGSGHHVIELVDREDQLLWALFVLDSGDHQGGVAGGYSTVHPEVIDWVGERLDAIEQSERRAETWGALVFQHIPLPEVNELWLTQPCRGYKLEGTCPPRTNTGLFHRLVQSGRVRGVFYGHDHVNDFYGDLHGITLAYGRATGFNTYQAEGFPRGGRILDLAQDASFETSVLLDGGEWIKKPSIHHPLIHSV